MAKILEKNHQLSWALVKTEDMEGWHIVRLIGNHQVSGIYNSAFAEMSDNGIRYVSSVNGTYASEDEAKSEWRQLVESALAPDDDNDEWDRGD
jgi:hypothetical protein